MLRCLGDGWFPNRGNLRRPPELARLALGRPISHADAQIAAIAKVRGAKLATRDVADFEDCGLDIVDPWNGS